MEQIGLPLEDVNLVFPDLFDTTHNNYSKPEFESIVRNLLGNLTHNDLKELRGVCSGLNSAIIGLDTFRDSYKCTWSKKWYKTLQTWTPSASVQWKELTLKKFSVHRKAKLFNKAWNYSAQRLTHLTLKNSSFECDGFSQLLNCTPNLEALTMDGIRCRDLKHIHVDAMEHGDNLRRVAFKNINIMEDCFFDYLINRTGNVEELQIENCFANPDDETYTVVVQNIGERFKRFLPNMVDFVVHNCQAITKMSIKNNGGQSEFWNLLMVHPQYTLMDDHLIDLEIQFPCNEFNPRSSLWKEPVAQFHNAVNFIRAKTGLQKLALEFKGPVTQAILESLILPHRDSLNAFVLSLPTLEPEIQVPLHLNFLGQLTHLRNLKLDYKLTPGRTDRELRDFETPIQTEFVHTLSEHLTEISMNGFIRNRNIFHPHQDLALQDHFAHRSRNLTKFEFTGPWRTEGSQRQLLDMIITNFVNLTSLTLKKCGLRDLHLLGTTWPNLITIIKRHIRHQRNVDLYPMIERCLRIRPWMRRNRLQTLAQLEYLDLSENTLVSDIGLFALQFPNLTMLNLQNCNRIKNAGLTNLIPRVVPNLEVIHLEGCYKIDKIGLNDLMNQLPGLKKIYTTKIVGKRDPDRDVLLNLNSKYDETVEFAQKRNRKPRQNQLILEDGEDDDAGHESDDDE